MPLPISTLPIFGLLPAFPLHQSLSATPSHLYSLSTSLPPPPPSPPVELRGAVSSSPAGQTRHCHVSRRWAVAAGPPLSLAGALVARRLPGLPAARRRVLRRPLGACSGGLPGGGRLLPRCTAGSCLPGEHEGKHKGKIAPPNTSTGWGEWTLGGGSRGFLDAASIK